jgi:hypothetical protein
MNLGNGDLGRKAARCVGALTLIASEVSKCFGQTNESNSSV